MNREFLEQLGLEKESIDKVMAEHGKSVQSAQVKVTDAEAEATSLKEQLTQRDADIKDLRKKSGSNEEVTAQLQALQDKYETETQAHESELKQTRTNAALEMALTKNQARNNKAVRALLDIDKLELTDDGVKGLDEQLKAVKEENPYLFSDASETGKPQFSKPGNPSGSNAVLSKKDIMAEKDATKRIELIQANPNLFTRKGE